jgi:hypothetical protein
MWHVGCGAGSGKGRSCWGKAQRVLIFWPITVVDQRIPVNSCYMKKQFWSWAWWFRRLRLGGRQFQANPRQKSLEDPISMCKNWA